MGGSAADTVSGPAKLPVQQLQFRWHADEDPWSGREFTSPSMLYSRRQTDTHTLKYIQDLAVVEKPPAAVAEPPLGTCSSTLRRYVPTYDQSTSAAHRGALSFSPPPPSPLQAVLVSMIHTAPPPKSRNSTAAASSPEHSKSLEYDCSTGDKPLPSVVDDQIRTHHSTLH